MRKLNRTRDRGPLSARLARGLISNAGARFEAPETSSAQGRFEDVHRGRTPGLSEAMLCDTRPIFGLQKFKKSPSPESVSKRSFLIAVVPATAATSQCVIGDSCG